MRYKSPVVTFHDILEHFFSLLAVTVLNFKRRHTRASKMLTEEDFNNFCLTKGLFHQTVSIRSQGNGFIVTINVKGKSGSKNYSATAETSASAFTAARQQAVDDIEQTYTVTTDPIEYLERERVASNLSYEISYTRNDEGYWGKIELKTKHETISLPFEAPNYARIHQCAAEKAQAYLCTLK